MLGWKVLHVEASASRRLKSLCKLEYLMFLESNSNIYKIFEMYIYVTKSKCSKTCDDGQISEMSTPCLSEGKFSTVLVN